VIALSLKSLKQKKKLQAVSYCQTLRKKNHKKVKLLLLAKDACLITVERVAPEVEVGDRIIFSKYAGTEVKYDGKEYLILRESDILAVIG
jgi:chaperonin GroES